MTDPQDLYFLINAESNARLQRLEAVKFFKKKYRLHIVCPDAHSLKTHPEFKDVHLIELKLSRSGKSILKELKSFWQIRKIMQSSKPNALFHAFTLKPILYANLIKLFSLKKFQIFSTFTGLGYLFINSDKHPVLFSLVKKLLRLCIKKNSAQIIFQNHTDQKFFIDQKIVTAASHVILGSGVDTDYFKEENYKLNLDKPINFLFIGRCLYDKGILETLKAFQDAPNSVKLKIAGDLDPNNPRSLTKTELDKYTSSNIEHLGHVDDIKKTINKADVVILPSYREGLPLALAQACSCSKPIITSQSAGCSEIISAKEPNGLLVPVKSVSAIKKALKFFTQLQLNEWEKMKDSSRRQALKLFCAKQVNSQILKLYQKF